jgi:hypothetical protein
MAAFVVVSLTLMYLILYIYSLTRLNKYIDRILNINDDPNMGWIPDFFLRKSQEREMFFVFLYESIYFIPFIAYMIGFSQRHQVEYFDRFNRLQIRYSIYQYSAEERSHIKN